MPAINRYTIMLPRVSTIRIVPPIQYWLRKWLNKLQIQVKAPAAGVSASASNVKNASAKARTSLRLKTPWLETFRRCSDGDGSAEWLEVGEGTDNDMVG